MSTTTFDSYVICTSPRSGSTLLCRLLAATGVSGNPESYFHEPSVSSWQTELDLSPNPSASEFEVLRDVFRAAIAQGSLDTGMFGLRLQRHSFDFFTTKLAVLYPDIATDRARFEAAFGRTQFLHLTRDDKVEQAVSYIKAQQSGLWHQAPDGTELERLSEPQELRYDRDQIQKEIDEMMAMDAAWIDWFAGEDIEPFRVTYKALSADPVGVLQSVLVRLGLDPDTASGVEPGTAKLFDRTNHEWVTRFRAEQDGVAANG
ncbi:MAG: Stf0 family sulfotransferase [Pseudomonadota bacterium]